MERLVKNIGPDIKPGERGQLAVFAGPPGCEDYTGEGITATNVGNYPFRSMKFGIADESITGDKFCKSLQL